MRREWSAEINSDTLREIVGSEFAPTMRFADEVNQ